MYSMDRTRTYLFFKGKSLTSVAMGKHINIFNVKYTDDQYTTVLASVLIVFLCHAGLVMTIFFR